MSNTEVYFNDGNKSIEFTDFNILNKHIFVCNNLPNSYSESELTLKLPTNNMKNNSVIEFKIIFNNQYPKSDISYNYIRNVLFNNVSQKVKINDIDLNNNILKNSHYISQRFIIKRNSLGEYIVLTEVMKFAFDDNQILNLNMVTVHRQPIGSYYDM